MTSTAHKGPARSVVTCEPSQDGLRAVHERNTGCLSSDSADRVPAVVDGERRERQPAVVTQGRFPFGQPVLPRPPSANEPRPVFVLGAYPSGFHVAWWLPGYEERRTPDARALIVDNEPQVFWDGTGAAELLTRWRSAVGFADHSWGRVDLPAHGNNGPSGQWLAERILRPLGHRREDCWITDCLDTARLNPGQAKRIEESYLRHATQLDLPIPDLQPTPKGEGGILQEAKQGHLDRLTGELHRAKPELIVTLGNAALAIMRELVEVDSGDPGKGLREETYGTEVPAGVAGRQVRWLPLVHPRSGERVPKWREIHAGWVERRA